jgi:hypothetical protein|tara:strand:- start:1391 stop:1561 length:171 start_codon:yes stop_codon:yes gene_type:complete
MTLNERFLEAVDIFGKDVVDEVIAIVNLSDPDSAYVQFEDDDLKNHVACIEFIYFN